jgi:hypothetical protein
MYGSVTVAPLDFSSGARAESGGERGERLGSKGIGISPLEKNEDNEDEVFESSVSLQPE